MKATKKMTKTEAFELLQRAKAALVRVNEGLEMVPRVSKNLSRALEIIDELIPLAEPTKLPEGVPAPVALLFGLLKTRGYEVEVRRLTPSVDYWGLSFNGMSLGVWREDAGWLADGVDGHLRYSDDKDFFDNVLTRLTGHPIAVVRLVRLLREGWYTDPVVERAEGLFLVSVSFRSVSFGAMFDPEKNCWAVQKPVKPFWEELPAKSIDVISNLLYERLQSSIESQTTMFLRSNRGGPETVSP